MTREEAIEYRAELKRKDKITAEEKYWLRNTPVYSKVLGSEYYRADKLQLEPKTRYLIKIECLHVDEKAPAMSCFDVPAGTNGYLMLDKNHVKEEGVFVEHCLGKEIIYSKPKKRKGMNFKMEKDEPIYFFFRSDTGILAISYMQWVIKDGRANWRCSTGPFMHSLAMEKKVISENKVVYGCCDAFGTKESIQGKDWFNKFIFSVEWTRVK